MVKRIEIKNYRKLKNISFDLDGGITAISGSNGTCKSSLLHIIGNSYQAVTTTDERLIDGSCATLIRRLNAVVNPKIESLTRGDKKYNDPARGCKGALYSVIYSDDCKLAFRRHNSKAGLKDRFSIKPIYKASAHESLPAAPVVYLGLSRLLPLGEYLDDEAVITTASSLPVDQRARLLENYRKFTLIKVHDSKMQHMGDIKSRIDFTTDEDGIDSNTISAGEDNLFIILLALQSLEYYCSNLKDGYMSEALLLVDELDATLHPAFQIKLIQLFKEYSEKNSNLQIVFTTHSMSLLEYMTAQNMNVIYLQDNITDVLKMEAPDMYKIRMDLQNKTHRDIYTKKVIPIFTEDDEARLFLGEIWDYFGMYNENFDHARRTIHMIKGKVGANNLESFFKDPALTQSSISSICILDGDKQNNPKFNIVSLPGNSSPEELVFTYANTLVTEDSDFWKNDDVRNMGYTKKYYLSNVQEEIDNMEREINDKRDSGESVEGVRRNRQKSIFNEHAAFFRYVIRCWLNDPRNKRQVQDFYKNFHNVYLKVAPYHGIDLAVWAKDSGLQIPSDLR